MAIKGRGRGDFLQTIILKTFKQLVAKMLSTSSEVRGFIFCFPPWLVWIRVGGGLNSWAVEYGPKIRVGRLSDHKHITAGEREQAVRCWSRAQCRGGGKVPAAHASDTLRTACLWGDFSGCGRRGGGRREKGAAEAVGGIDGRTACLYQRPTAVGGGGDQRRLDSKCR